MRHLPVLAAAFAMIILAAWPGAGQSTKKAPAKAPAASSPAKSAPAAAPKKAATPSKSTASATPSKSATPAAPKKSTATTAAKKTTTTKKKTTVRTTWRNRQTAPTAARYREIQNALVAKGFLDPEAATGVWKDSSISALKDFQAAQNLQPSGKIDSLSLIALGLGPVHEAPESIPPGQP